MVDFEVRMMRNLPYVHLPRSEVADGMTRRFLLYDQLQPTIGRIAIPMRIEPWGYTSGKYGAKTVPGAESQRATAS
jgi:hypothetical protein